MSTHRRLLLALLAAYLLIASTYSVATPLFEVSDELWHYPMVKYIADNGGLPVQDPANPGPWRQEGSQPPLYYMLGAALTFWIDTSDMEQVRRINPHADIGVIRPDGNANMMVHRSNLEAFPWRNTALAVHIVRFMSVLMGMATVYVTYLLGRELFEDWPEVALIAAALVAFLPMFVFIHGSVNNDALSNLLGNLVTLLLVRLLKRDAAPTLIDYTVVGAAMGAGLLAKGNIAFLILIVALVLLILSFRFRDWKPFFVGGFVSGGLTILIASWWYIRNWQLYGDPTGLNTFLDTVGRRLIPANAQQLWAERNSFLQAYWGFFGGVNVALPDWAYIIFNVIGGFALLSGIVFLAYLAINRKQTLRWWLAASVTLIWPVITFISYLRWTAITPASQGRLVFGALSSISLWMAVGLAWPWRRNLAVPSMAVAYFAAVSIITPFALIIPTYTPPGPPAQITDPLATFSPRASDEPGTMHLLDARVITQSAQPRDYILIESDWQMEQTPSRNWSLFVHLATPDGVIIGQRDVYPGRGLLATSELEEGRAWQNPVAVNVPAGAYAPMQLDVWIGWYHLPTGERMITSDGEETVTIGSVELLPNDSDFDLPNPISVNFDNQIELIGYELSTLTPQPGEEMSVDLYWRAQRAPEENYVIFVHLIDTATAAIVAGSDAMPVEWTRPTMSWQVGEIIQDTHTMTVNADANPQVYELEIGMYSREDDGMLPRLRVVTPDGGMANDYFYLSRMRVIPDAPQE